ncbi:YceD family protein [Tropicimonas sediminicola]|uniref:Uncharacterized metal-binding protein YceD, DUF177 family n=1 Tax=Tropicimonas sediminicola TaxID=1031541 RepID=A0A239GYK4_9RHOB|nr:YceD family protein [Tropicimonas sediminicola]SNS73878.1 Uncharacterized metal-binding protein YceD, DUF177 family [Tropicimonas sediminicola]
MTSTDAPSKLRLSRLPTTRPTPFKIVPDAEAMANLAGELDLIDLRKLRLEGQMFPDGPRDWRLEARLGATVVQPCSVTLAPVTTRIEAPVVRRYTADYSVSDEAEAEMPEDDSLEPLPEVLDLDAVLAEALALALPDFPRADGAELGEAVFAAPDTQPLRDEDVKPFAGLADLKKRLES